MEVEGSRLQRFDVGFFHGKQVQVDAVIEAVAAVPAMFPDIIFQGLGLLGKTSGDVGQIQTVGQVFHGQKLLVHEGIQEDGARTFVRPVESAGVVVYADGFVGFPIHQSVALWRWKLRYFSKGCGVLSISSRLGALRSIQMGIQPVHAAVTQ